MGYTLAFQNPGSIFRKGSATTGVAAAPRKLGRARDTRESPTLACVYFIDNAYRVPSLAATGRRNKVPCECSAEKVAAVFFVPADFICA